jgi:hypothetical protein
MACVPGDRIGRTSTHQAGAGKQLKQLVSQVE